MFSVFFLLFKATFSIFWVCFVVKREAKKFPHNKKFKLILSFLKFQISFCVINCCNIFERGWNTSLLNWKLVNKLDGKWYLKNTPTRKRKFTILSYCTHKVGRRFSRKIILGGLKMKAQQGHLSSWHLRNTLQYTVQFPSNCSAVYIINPAAKKVNRPAVLILLFNATRNSDSCPYNYLHC